MVHIRETVCPISQYDQKKYYIDPRYALLGVNTQHNQIFFVFPYVFVIDHISLVIFFPFFNKMTEPIGSKCAFLILTLPLPANCAVWHSLLGIDPHIYHVISTAPPTPAISEAPALICIPLLPNAASA